VIRALAALALVALAGQDRPPATPPGEGSGEAGALARTPAALPRAAPGRWEGFFERVHADPAAADGLLGAEVAAGLARAEALYGEGDLPGAVGALFELLEREPDLPPAWLILGTAYFRLRRYEDAARALERFLDVAPGELWRTQALGHAYYSLGEYERARDHYRRVVAIARDSAEAWRGLALAEMRLGEDRAALAGLRRVLALEPEHPEAHLWIARILRDGGFPRAALPYAVRARELAPHEPQPWFLAAQVLRDLGGDEEAAACERRWKELDPIAQELRAVEARERLEPRRFDLAWRRFELERARGHAAGVRDAFARALALRPAGVDELGLRLTAVEALHGLGDADGARREAAAVEAAFPEDPAAWAALETFYAAIRDRAAQVRAGERRRRFAEAVR